MPHEIRFTPFEYLSPQSQKRYDCLRINFDYADAALKAKLKALGMRWASKGDYFYFEQVEGQPRGAYALPRPKQPAQLPKVLDEEEIK